LKPQSFAVDFIDLFHVFPVLHRYGNIRYSSPFGREDLFFDPAGNDTVDWTPSAGTNWECVDDGTRQPTAPGADENTAGSPGDEDDYTVTQTVTFAGNSASIDLWAYVSDTTPATDNITFDLYIASAWQGAEGITAGTELAWHNVTFTGVWTQAQVRAAKIRITKASASDTSTCRAFYGLVVK